MDYFLSCSCGDGVTVLEAAAGTTVQCRCGRPVRVPSFRELRERFGQPAPEPPPERVVEALLLSGQLPQERGCVLCGTGTDHSVCYRTICEQAEVDTGARPWWQIALSATTLGWLAALLVAADRRPERELGNDKIYSLPLRVCKECVATLTTEDAVKEALARIPVYRRLLEKYPDAEIEMPAR